MKRSWIPFLSLLFHRENKKRKETKKKCNLFVLRDKTQVSEHDVAYRPGPEISFYLHRIGSCSDRIGEEGESLCFCVGRVFSCDFEII